MSLDKRVEELEKQMGELKEEISKLKMNSKPTTITIERPLPFLPKREPEPEPEPSLQTKESVPIDWEMTIGQVWLPRIFIFVLLLGVLWGFKAASDYGFITESVRMIVGFVVSGVLIWIGNKQVQKGRGTLGQVLLGGSIVTLMLSTFAGHMLYDIIPIGIAFPLNVLWIVLGIYFAHRYKSESLSVIAALGGFLIPFLIETSITNPWYFVSYMTILYVSLMVFALKNKFRYLFYVSFILLTVILLFRTLFMDRDSFALSAGFLVQHATLLIAYLKKNIFMRSQLTALFTSFVMTIGMLHIFSDGVEFTLWLIGFFLLYAGLAVYQFKKKDMEKMTTATVIGVFGFMLFLMDMFDGNTQSILLTLEGLLTLYLGLKLKRLLTFWSGVAIYIIGISFIFSNDIHKVLSLDSLSWIVGLGSLLVIYQLLERYAGENKKTYLRLVGGFSIFIGLVFLTLETNLLTVYLSSDSQHLVVSAVWAAYALIGMIYGIKTDKTGARLAGVILLFATLLKLIFVDLPSVSIIIRAVLFIGLGGIGILISRMFYKK